jgi:hypothetical protein
VRPSKRISAVQLAVMALLAGLSEAAEDRRAPAFATPVSVPFRLHEHLILVDGGIGDLEGLSIVLDTGASSAVVSSRIDKRLGLVREGAVAVNTWGTKQRLDRVSLPSVTLGGLHFGPLRASVANLPRVGGTRVDALIGLDLLGRFDFTIDFASRRIVFGPVPNLQHEVTLLQHPRFLAVPLRVAGTRIWVMLDSGADGLTLFRNEVPEEVSVRRTFNRRAVPHIAGFSRLEKAYVGGVRLAAVDLGEVPVHLLDPRDAPPTRNLRGILGITWLGFQRISFDFTRKRIGFGE